MADEEIKKKTPFSAENSPSVPLAGEEEMVPPPPPSSDLNSEKQKEKNASPSPSQKEIEGASVTSPLPPSSPAPDSNEKVEGKNDSPPPPPPGKRETIAATVGLPPKKKFSFDKRIFLIILVIFLALVGIVAGVYLVKQNQNPKKSAEGGPCNPPGCQEAFCGWQEGQGEVAMCHTCQDNYHWTDAVVCSQYFGDVCHDPNNPNDNTAKSLGGCSYNPPPTCGDGTCDTNENCDPTSDHYCPADCHCATSTPSAGSCPDDVTPYVVQTGQLQPGYANCNGNAWCLELHLPPEYAHCLYKAEAYADYPQDCENQQAHQLISKDIGDGGKICFSDFNWGSYCKAQLDIRADRSGAPAGNVKTYKINCGGGGTTATPTPFVTSTPTPPATLTPTSPPTATPTPPTECACAEIFLFNESWGLLWRREDGELVGGGENLVSPGETVHLVIAGYKIGRGSFDKAKLFVNDTNLGESTTQADETVIATIKQLGGHTDSYEGFFTFDYTIPPEGGNFWFTGQIHFVDLNGEGRWLGEMPTVNPTGFSPLVTISPNPSSPIVPTGGGNQIPEEPVYQ